MSLPSLVEENDAIGLEILTAIGVVYSIIIVATVLFLIWRN